MIDTEKLTLAIAAHAKWKHLLKEAIDSQKCDRSIESVKSDAHCDFGKWLMTLSAADRTSKQWQAIHKLHAEFHVAAAKVLELALRGKRDEANAELTMQGAFTRISSQLTVAVSNWKRELTPKP